MSDKSRLPVRAAWNLALPWWSRLDQGRRGLRSTEVISVDVSTAVPEPSRALQDQSGDPSRRGNPELGGSAPHVSGTVKWYDPVKGFGFIAVESESKDLFVHVSVVERAGLGALEQGQAVRVSIVEGRKGREVGTIERI